jgi:uncharacterized integral membrane protein
VIWTPRQYKYITRIKKRMANLSRPVKFPPDTLVRYISGGVGHIYVVDHNSKEDWCWINHRSFASPVHTPESELRALYWYEFAFHRDPMKGEWMIGKNKAIPLLYALAVLLVGTIASLKTVEGAWKWGCPAILAMFLAGTIIGTIRNAKGKQF